MTKKKKAGNLVGSADAGKSPFVSPNELAERWRCGRSSVDRICAKAGMKRVFLGQGKNGMVRYLLAEVEAYERVRTI